MLLQVVFVCGGSGGGVAFRKKIVEVILRENTKPIIIIFVSCTTHLFRPNGTVANTVGTSPADKKADENKF